MSQTACLRRPFAVPLRWLHAGGDPSRPDSGQSIRSAPVDTPQTLPERFFHALARRHMQAFGVASPRCPASNQGAATLKSP